MSNMYVASEKAALESKQFLYQVYSWMGLAILLTAVTSFFASRNEIVLNLVFATAGGFPVGLIVLVLAEVGLVWYLSARIFQLTFETGAALFALYAFLNGVTLSSIFLVYSLGSITSTFFVCSAMFFSVSLWGYATKTDLSKWGNILFMGLIGIILASLVNMFLQSSVMGWIISFVGVIVFTGLTAYDTWKIKQMKEDVGSDAVAVRKVGLLGALTLYLDFINLFLMLLRFFGGRRD